MKVISVNIGKKKTVTWKNKTYVTGIYKYPVEDSIFLGKEDVVNDDVIDRKYHGGIDQAVYAYGENHYAYWKDLYPNLEFNYGMFGENLTISDLFEEELTVGSIYQLGTCKLEVTKPRQPCVKLGIRFQDVKVIKQFWNTSKSGVYFKVLEIGKVTKNDVLTLLEKANNTPSIAKVYESKK
ncbi:MAG: MOSC domain-containing protein [Flavobacteriaceae bacterium]|nr:MOSC domain-containing protein [Flavobacteriaceae bacterium]